MKFTRVLAPFDGVVTSHQADLGNLVGASGPTTLATIVQTDPVYVTFTVSEPRILALRRSVAPAGLPLRRDLAHLSSIPVEIGLQDEDGYPHKGHLDYVSP
jgi:multidrug efflux system membrane fusion protein